MFWKCSTILTLKTTKPQTEKGSDKHQLKTSYIDFLKPDNLDGCPGHAAKWGEKEVILLFFQCRYTNYLNKSDECFLLKNEWTIVSVISFVQYLHLLFIEKNSKVLIDWERWMKSSYPFGSCPNLQLWHHHRVLKTHIRHYDVICSYIENTYMTLWRHTNLCCLCQMRKNTNGRLLQGKDLQIQINNKTIIGLCYLPLP